MDRLMTLIRSGREYATYDARGLDYVKHSHAGALLRGTVSRPDLGSAQTPPTLFFVPTLAPPLPGSSATAPLAIPLGCDSLVSMELPSGSGRGAVGPNATHC